MAEVTQRELARELGVSTATVSLALQGHPRIPEATRRKVRRLAQRRGYTADPALSALAGRRWSNAARARGTVAILFPNRSDHPRPDPLVKAHLEPAARERQLRLEAFFLSEVGSFPRTLEVVRARGIEGVVLPPSLPPEAFHHPLLQGFAAIAVNPDKEQPQLDQVRQSAVDGLRLLLDRVPQGRFRRPACAFVYERTLPEHFEAALALFEHLRPEGTARIPPWLGGLGDSNQLADWAGRHRPDLIIGSTSHVYWKLRSAGYRIPRDFAFAALQQPGTDRRVAGIRNDFPLQCIAAIDWIDQKLRRRELGPGSPSRAIVLLPEWQDGASLPGSREVTKA